MLWASSAVILLCLQLRAKLGTAKPTVQKSGRAKASSAMNSMLHLLILVSYKAANTSNLLRLQRKPQVKHQIILSPAVSSQQKEKETLEVPSKA